ncbi:hypothetical protein MNBD_NITROSPIRAE01-2222 [hydrothermal vent metagenome]|uniref:Protein kinase domain-containing protein n=1 Tax=hydrothermal vent metagenome TaxID=652676 RepID=A0A3B1DPN9_9ZZZZ
MNFESVQDDLLSPLLSVLPLAENYLQNLSPTTIIAYFFLIVLMFWGYSLFKKYRVMQLESSLSSSRNIMRAARSGDPLMAGELYEQAQDYQQAIDAYKSVRAFQEVGRVHEHLKQWDDAAQFYRLSGDLEKSAIMYQRGGNYLQAAESYLSCNKNILAAEMYEKGREYKKAATQYEKFGKQLKSAHLYKLSEDYERAAEKYEAYFLKQKVVSSNHSIEKQQQVKQAAFESGTLYVKIKRFRKAMNIFSNADFPEQAADAAVHAGEIEKAAQFYLAAHLFEKAAKIYDAMGDEKQGHWIMAKKYQEEGDLLEAAKAFELGESWVEAAEMYGKAGDTTGAAEMYQHAGDYHRSADLFLANGNLDAAAKSLERGGRLEEAAELYVKMKKFDRAAQMQELIGDYYAAALLLKQEGHLDRCISYLQKVNPDSQDFFSASVLLGELLLERGMVSAAKDCLHKIIAKYPVSDKNIEVYYRLATLHESEKSFKEAEALYAAILQKDYNYRDAKQRSALLKKTLKEIKEQQNKIESEDSIKIANSAPNTPTRYKMIRKIGQGGMGVVYLAEDAILKRQVAYKILPQSIRENAAVLQNFLQEARIAAALNHPNIVTIFDTGKNADDIYITMEFIDGISLKHYLERYKSPLNERVEIMKSICRGVIYAHERQVIHRDLKPANVMLLKDRTVKIMDFGLAKMMTEGMQEKTTIKGTPLYMSPEQIVGEKVDMASDIYSLGCTFYRMLTNRPPFSKGDIYYQHLHTPPTPPKMLKSDIPSSLDTIILKCLEKQQEKRFKSVKTLLEALSHLTQVPALS